MSKSTAPAGGKPAAEAHSAAAGAAAANGVLDWSVAQASVRGDEVLLQEIVTIFLDECPAMLDTVHAALAAGDVERLRIGAHTLKGAVVHFGASAAVAAAAGIEAAARQSDLQSAAGLCQTLAAELDRLTPHLADYLHSARNTQGPLYAVSPGR